MSEIPCRKKQVEIKGGQENHRCLHKEATTYKGYVDDSVCGSCPLRVFAEPRVIKIKGKPNTGLPVLGAAEGFPTCEFRAGRICMVTNKEVTAAVCQRCAIETKDHIATLPEKFTNYATAIRKWIAAGRPVRSDAVVEEIFEKHCSTCSMFDPKKRACKSCGCAVNKSPFPLTNKLKMATESCPLGLFPEGTDHA